MPPMKTRRPILIILILLSLVSTLGIARCGTRPVPETRPNAPSVPNDASRLQFYLYNYYLDVMRGRIDNPVSVETRVRELLAVDPAPGSIRVVTTTGIGRDTQSGETRPIITCFVAEGRTERRAVMVGQQSVDLTVTLYHDVRVQGYNEFSGARYVAWRNPRGEEIYLNQDIAERDAAAIITDARMEPAASSLEAGITPALLAEREALRHRTARAFYAREGQRYGSTQELREAVVEEVILHEAQHERDARQAEIPIGYVQREYRAILRGMTQGNLPYMNIGRMIASQGMGRSDPFRRAATILLSDLVDLTRRRYNESPQAGVEILLKRSPEELSRLAADLFERTENRFWFVEEGGAELRSEHTPLPVVPSVSGSGPAGGIGR